jgi:hypothetical protein
VEDGTPFCRQCGAPQIRVPGIEAVESSAPGPAGIAPTESAPEVPSIPSVLLSERGSPGVQWAHALPGAALGAVVSLFSLLPFAVLAPAFGGLGFFLGGALAVLLYRRHVKSHLSAGAGAKIGAASGAFAFLYVAIAMIGILQYNPEACRKAMVDSAPQLTARGYDAQKLQQLLEQVKTPEGLTSMVVTFLFYGFLIMIIGSSIGGALYAAWARRRAQM